MISKQELSYYCNARTMQRAERILRTDLDIVNKKVRYDRGKTTLSAYVVSSQDINERYRVQVSVNSKTDDIDDYSCTCPAYHRFDGMCKHCAAVTLSYIQHPSLFSGYQQDGAIPTSSSLMELMERTRSARIQPQTEPGTVRLEPTLLCDFGEWYVHFKIAGQNGTYVLKDINHFCQLVQAGETYRYGKNLEFTHTLDAFDEETLPLVRFLIKATTARTSMNSSVRNPWSTRTQASNVRLLALSSLDAIELLDLLGSNTFIVECTDYGQRAKTHAHVVQETPQIDISIAPEEGSGFTVRLMQDFLLIAQGSRAYVWLDDIFYNCSKEFAACAPLLRILQNADADDVFINQKDMPLFCATTLPQIEGTLQIDAPQSLDAFKPVPCQLEFYFDRTKDLITCVPVAVYAHTRYALLDPDDAGTRNADAPETTAAAPAPLRDEALEAAGLALVRQYFAQTALAPATADEVPAIQAVIPMEEDQAAANLVFGGLTAFQNLGEAFTTPAFDALLSSKKPHVSMGLSLSGNLINLTVSSDDIPSEELGALLASYRQHKRFHKLKSGAYLDIAEMNLAELDRIAQDLEIQPKDLTSGMVELPAYRAFYLDEQLDEARRDGAFMHYVERFHQLDQASYAPPTLATGQLRPYQIEGFRWLSSLCDLGFGGILADEMGLGKSVQLISFLLSRAEEAREVGPALIACPASLVYNWAAEFERFAPQMRVQTIAGTKQERVAARATEGVDVFVTSYDLMRIDATSWATMDLYAFVLDEAQYIKNHGTQTSRAAKRIQAQHRFALTGTPMENRLSEIWSIFDFLMPGFLGSYMRFRERFELDIIGGDEDVADRLHALIGPFMLRRLKSNVLTDLPDKLEQVIFAPMGKEQRRLYDAHEQKLREDLTLQRQMRKQRALNKAAGKPVSDVEVLSELMKLRQICCDPRLLYDNFKGEGAKISAIMDLVESCISNGQKMLIFSQFTSFLSLIETSLEKQGIAYFEITGATPKKQRVTLVDTFNEDDTPVFLVSLKAGGTGLNLTGASVVVHADPWWNAAAQNQATDRAHRIGQTKVVSVHKIIAKDTIEERIMLLQDMKNELADQIIGGEGVSLSSLTKDELLDLLEG